MPIGTPRQQSSIFTNKSNFNLRNNVPFNSDDENVQKTNKYVTILRHNESIEQLQT